MTTWIIVFALALLSIVVFVFALRSQQDAEALEDRLAGTIDEEAASHPHQAGGIEPLPEWIQPAARFGLKLAGNDKSRETTALLLAQAGFARPGSLGVFLLLKTLLGLGIAAALFSALRSEASALSRSWGGLLCGRYSAGMGFEVDGRSALYSA
ncbi:hypothetical protein [Sutterella wadsworthensis]|uniref:hypothetical protein n=1 Tax=Sutterella wadsworthensis TaxID=40545 RepID=UPI003966D506